MRYIRITSLQNPLVKEGLKIKQKRSKYRHEAFIIDGHHLIEMAAASQAELRRVFFTEDFISKKEGQRILRQIYTKIRDKAADNLFVQTSREVLSKLSDTETPQGILAIASCNLTELKEIRFKESPFLIVCDGIQDAGNLGTIIRASDAAGADGVIMLPNTCDAFSQKTIRATAGSIFNIPIVYSEIDNLLEYINLNKIRLYATDVHAGMPIYKFDFKGPLAVVFGNEARGVSEKLKKAADGLANIPIIGKAESLNVAMAASIFLYELVRQRKYSY